MDMRPWVISPFLSLAILLTSCDKLASWLGSHHDLSQETQASLGVEILNPELNDQVMTLFSNKCASCHGENSAGLGGLNYILDVQALVLQGQVVPGESQNSKIYKRVLDGTMPPGIGLSSTEVSLIQSWIDTGLKLSVSSGPLSGPVPSPAPENIVPPPSDWIADQTLFDNFMVLLQTKCASCHGSLSPGYGNLNYVLDVKQLIEKNQILPGSPDGSKLYRRTVDLSMPPGVGLSGSEIKLISDFIQFGLATDSPTLPKPAPTIEFPPGASDLTKQALTILSDRCTSCHNSSTGNTTGGGVLNVIDPQQIQISGLAVPGNALQSPLYLSIVSTHGVIRMPKSPGTPLSSANTQTIRDWIDTDLKTDSPSIPGYTVVPLTATFHSIRMNILATRCVVCHGGTLGTEEGKNYSDYTSTRRSVKPGNPVDSELYKSVTVGEMPQDYLRLKSSETSAISQWILNGAPND